MMRGDADGLLFSVVAVWISFAFGEGSFETFHTQEGCNATLLCHQSGNVTWLKTVTAQKVEGPRFQTSAYGFFSTLVITGVSTSDRGNITCVGQEHNLTIDIEVCSDAPLASSDCNRDIVRDPSVCNYPWYITNCKKSCDLCPDCRETVLPTLPPTAATPQVMTSMTSHTHVSTKPSTESGTRSSTQVKLDLANSAASWSSGFQAFSAFFFALFSFLSAFGSFFSKF